MWSSLRSSGATQDEPYSTRQDAQAREAAEEVVGDERRQRVGDRPLGERQRVLHQRVAVRRRMRPQPPRHVVDLAERRAPDVVDDDDARPPGSAPRTGSKCGSPGERPSIGPVVTTTKRAPRASSRSSSASASPRSTSEQQRRAVDAPVAAVAPVLLEPAVEGAQARVERLAVARRRAAAARRRRPRSAASGTPRRPARPSSRDAPSRSTNSGTASASIGRRLGLPPSSLSPRRNAFIAPGGPTLSPTPTLKKWQRSSPTHMRPGPCPVALDPHRALPEGASMCRVKQSSGS